MSEANWREINEMARLDEETSKALFDTLAQWNEVLKAESVKGENRPQP